MKLFAILLAVMTSVPAFAEKICYQISENGQVWSRTPEDICFEQVQIPFNPAAPDGPMVDKTRITLETGMAPFRQTYASFLADILPSGNNTVWGISNPSNSIFTLTLSITMTYENGPQDVEGRIVIGANEYYYRSY